MKCVNRVGILLEFLWFWFAGPELLGEERLKAWGQRLEWWLRVIVVIVWFLLLCLLWVVFSDLMPDEVVEMMPVIVLISASALLSVVSALPLIMSDEVHNRAIRRLLR
jgi:hypothetical protein